MEKKLKKREIYLHENENTLSAMRTVLERKEDELEILQENQIIKIQNVAAGAWAGLNNWFA